VKHEFVYFIKPIGLDGPVKIGCSMVPENRLINLTVWSPWPLEILVTIPGGQPLEANIHDCFADSHSHREWFRSTPRLRKLIDDLKSGLGIEAALDLSDRKANLRNRNRFYGNDVKLRMSYRMRVNWAERQLRKKDENGAWDSPADVQDILDRWSGYGNQASVQPTPEQFARLDEFLSDPEKFCVIPPWRKQKAAA